MPSAFAAPGAAFDLAAEIVRLAPRQVVDAFVQYPDVVMAFVSMALAAGLISAFWVILGMARASSAAQIALRATALRRGRDHRALILIGNVEGGGHALRQEMKEAVEDNFGLFAFQGEVQVDLFPISLPVLAPKADTERRRRVAVEAVDALERASGDIIVWGRKTLSGRLDLRIAQAPLPGRVHEVQEIQLGWRVGRPTELVQRALAFACARKARPVLNKPQDYKPERLQPIVEALDKMIDCGGQADISEGLQLDLLNDFASGALSLGERGGALKWLQKSLDARQRYLDKVDRTQDPAAWGAAQQEIGRALASLGEREGARDKLEEAVSRLRIAMDALRSSDSMAHHEVAQRALVRAEQTLQQRRRVGLRWPV